MIRKVYTNFAEDTQDNQKVEYIRRSRKIFSWLMAFIDSIEQPISRIGDQIKEE